MAQTGGAPAPERIGGADFDGLGGEEKVPIIVTKAPTKRSLRGRLRGLLGEFLADAFRGGFPTSGGGVPYKP